MTSDDPNNGCEGDYIVISVHLKLINSLGGQCPLILACVAGAKRGGRGEGEKHERGKREGGAPYPPPFSLFPYPLPLSTSATQAT